jgi:ElaB/YqjD/DUF883 family membrane-anchored ribosome-binding protein
MSHELTTDEINEDLRAVLADAEALVQETASLGGEKLLRVRARAEESVRAVKARMAQTNAAVRLKTRAAVDATDSYVHDNPWEAIGVAAAAGLVIGVLIARR